MSGSNRLCVLVETHSETKTLTVGVKLPGHAPRLLTGDLAKFREFVEATATWLGEVEGKGVAQDFRADMRRVEVAAEAEFGA